MDTYRHTPPSINNTGCCCSHISFTPEPTPDTPLNGADSPESVGDGPNKSIEHAVTRVHQCLQVRTCTRSHTRTSASFTTTGLQRRESFRVESFNRSDLLKLDDLKLGCVPLHIHTKIYINKPNRTHPHTTGRSKVGEGSFGIVYEGRFKGKAVAVKVLEFSTFELFPRVV